MNGMIASRASWCPKPTRHNAIQDSTTAMNSSVVVISSAEYDPIAGGSAGACSSWR